MKPFISKLIKDYSRDKLRIYSSSASFYIVVSALPLIAILIFSLSHLSTDLIRDFKDLIQGVLPKELFKELNTIILSLSQKKASAYVPFSILAAIWGSTKGIGGLCHGIESIYNIRQSHSFFVRASKSLWRALVFYVLMIGAILILSLRKLIHVKSPISILFVKGRVVITAFLLFFALTLFFSKIRSTSFKKQTLGGIFSSIGCILFTYFYSIYISYALRVQSIYAEMGTIIFFMLWVYFCVNIILIGAEIGKVLHKA